MLCHINKNPRHLKSIEAPVIIQMSSEHINFSTIQFVDKVDPCLSFNSRFEQGCQLTTERCATKAFLKMPCIMEMFHCMKDRKPKHEHKDAKMYEHREKSHCNRPSTQLLAPTSVYSRCSYLSDNNIIYSLLCYYNPQVNLYPLCEQETMLKTFQATIADSLMNERQLFKLYGFNKKKGWSADSMAMNLKSSQSDNVLGDPELSYLAKYVNIKLILFCVSPGGIVATTRKDYECEPGTGTSVHVLLHKDVSRTSLVFGEDAVFKAISNIICTLEPCITPEKMKVEVLKHVCQLFGLQTKGLKKTELQALLLNTLPKY